MVQKRRKYCIGERIVIAYDFTVIHMNRVRLQNYLRTQQIYYPKIQCQYSRKKEFAFTVASLGARFLRGSENLQYC